MFLSTRNYDYIYNFIVKSAKKNCENIYKKNLDLLIFQRKKLPTLKYFLFFIFIIISGKIFRNNRATIRYDNIEIGRFVLAQTFRNYESYLNKIKFYYQLFKNFIKAGALINTCEYYNKKYKISGVYADHCGYLNGIIFSFFALKKNIVYTNNYPHGIYFVNYKKNQTKYLLKYENSLRINVKKKLNRYQKKTSEAKISNIVKKATFIPYMAKANYKKLDDINYKSFDFVLYCHSFTDGQLWHGFAGFENTLDWLEFTLDNLVKQNKKILVKPHPNFYNYSMSDEAVWDKKIYNTVIEKYKKYKNLYFMKIPTHNYLLLKKLNKKCILLSGFGTAILESAYMNFKSICTTQNTFDQKFKISNMWENKKEYLKLMNSQFSKLKKPVKNDLLELIYTLIFHYPSTYHKNFYNRIIMRNLKLSKKQFEQGIFKKRSSEIANIDSLVEKKIINEISKSIYEVKKVNK
ncbi:hypothetical protein OAP78_02600 [Candidatus Pelagibacter sp.]|nr:hypothetical protein [Candidatus Pelagibacter sp.]